MCDGTAISVYVGENCSVEAFPPTFSIASSYAISEDTSFLSDVPTLLTGQPPITWSLRGIPPAGMTVDDSTGQVSWIVPMASTKAYVIELHCSNNGGYDIQTFELTVAAAYNVSASADKTLVVDGTNVKGVFFVCVCLFVFWFVCVFRMYVCVF